MEIKLGLVYHKEEEAILNTLQKNLEQLAGADSNTLNLTIAEVDVLINCLSFNLLAAEKLFATEWMAFLKANNKRFSVLFRPCVWELSYFSNFKILPENHSPLLEVDYETSGFKCKTEEIYDHILHLKTLETTTLNGISEAKVEQLKSLIIKDYVRTQCLPMCRNFSAFCEAI